MNMTCPKVWCDFFKAVHDHHRQHILALLQKHGSMTAGQIVAQIELAQPTISHHLKILTQAQIIHSKKQGKEVIYSINKASINQCCGGFMDRFGEEK